jgi:outer membrane protein
MSKTIITNRLVQLATGLAFIATLSLAGTSAMAAPAGQAATQGAPAPKILVIDQSAILRASKVGQDIVRQVKQYDMAMQSDFKGQSDSLRQEYQTLQQQVAILAPDVKAQKIKAFEAKQQAFQQKIEDRQGKIQGGVLKARQQIEGALGPILQGIMAERGANLLLDRNSVVFSTVDVDITRVAIQRLDQKMPTVKVTLTDPPPGYMQALAAQQQQQQQGQ